MAGIFYNPDVWDWGGKAIQGGLAGMAMVKNAQDIQSGKRKMDMEKRIDAANAEIADLYKETQGKLQGMPKIEALPDNANEGITSMAKSPALAEQSVAGGTEEQAGLARAAQIKDVEGNKQRREQSVQAKTEIMADLSRKRHDIYLKHNLPELADKIRTQHVAEAAALGKNVSEKVAFSYLKKGPLADMMEGVTEKDFSKDGDKWHITFKDGNTYSYNEKTGETRIEEGTHEKTEKDTMGGSTGLRHFKKGGFDITEEYDKETKTWKEKGRTPINAGGAGGAGGKDEKWTIPKIRQEWDKAESLIGKRIKEIQSELSLIGDEQGPDQKAASPLNTELDSLRKVQRNIPAYRDNDADAVKRGHDPINYGKVARYIANPEVGAGRAAGKVGEESKGLIKGKYSKVVEDPRTKKRYGVKPDGTKEPIQ